jgi:glycine hydroxymethyltransferase
MIFYRKGPVVVGGETFNLEDSINWAVFPALQGGPHDHQIAAVAVALKEAMTPEFVEYQRQVLKNAKCLADELMALGYSIVSKGTSNHLMLLDLNPKKIDGARAELVLDKAHITVNKNTVPGDTKPLVPGGLRLGTPALTTRGMKEAEVKKIAQFLDSGLKLTMEINTQDGNGVEVAVEWRLVVV